MVLNVVSLLVLEAVDVDSLYHYHCLHWSAWWREARRCTTHGGDCSEARGLGQVLDLRIRPVRAQKDLVVPRLRLHFVLQGFLVGLQYSVDVTRRVCDQESLPWWES